MEIIRDRSIPLAVFNKDRSSPVPTVRFGITRRAGPARPIHFRPVGLVCRKDAVLVWWVGGGFVLGYSGAMIVIIRDRSIPLAVFNQDRSSPVPTVRFGITRRAGPARPI